MKKDKDKEKESKKKQRYLSPSFRKGGIVKDTKKDEDSDDGDFKINLIEAEEDEEEKSPSPPKKRSEKRKSQEDMKKVNMAPIKGGTAEQQSTKEKEKKSVNVNALKEGHVKNVGSFSQAGKGEDGFTKVNQDSFLVLETEYNLKDFNIFCVMDGHGVNGHLVSRYVMKYINLFFKNNKKYERQRKRKRKIKK